MAMEEGHCTARGRHAREVGGLGYVARVDGEVFHPVRMPEERAVKPQNTRVILHVACADELRSSRKAHSLIIHAFDPEFFRGFAVEKPRYSVAKGTPQISKIQLK